MRIARRNPDATGTLLVLAIAAGGLYGLSQGWFQLPNLGGGAPPPSGSGSGGSAPPNVAQTAGQAVGGGAAQFATGLIGGLGQSLWLGGNTWCQIIQSWRNAGAPNASFLGFNVPFIGGGNPANWQAFENWAIVSVQADPGPTPPADCW